MFFAIRDLTPSRSTREPPGHRARTGRRHTTVGRIAGPAARRRVERERLFGGAGAPAVTRTAASRRPIPFPALVTLPGDRDLSPGPGPGQASGPYLPTFSGSFGVA